MIGRDPYLIKSPAEKVTEKFESLPTRRGKSRHDSRAYAHVPKVYLQSTADYLV